MVTHSYILVIKSKDILARRWFWIFWYFERNVPLQLPRHYSLPLPRFNILTKSFFSSLVSTSSQFPTSSPSNVIKGWKEMAVEQNPAVQVILITNKIIPRRTKCFRCCKREEQPLEEEEEVEQKDTGIP